MSYESDQDKWIREVNLQVGDKVLVVAQAEGYRNGWVNSWAPDMPTGVVLEVAEVYQDGISGAGIGLRVDNGGQDIYGYPFFVLVKIN